MFRFSPGRFVTSVPVGVIRSGNSCWEVSWDVGGPGLFLVSPGSPYQEGSFPGAFPALPWSSLVIPTFDSTTGERRPISHFDEPFTISGLEQGIHHLEAASFERRSFMFDRPPIPLSAPIDDSDSIPQILTILNNRPYLT